jgi:hypothetical protein
VPDRVHVGTLLGDDEPLGPQGGHHRRAGLEAIQTQEGARRGDHPTLVEHRDRRQPVPLADLEVVRVVPRGDLHRARAEGRVDLLVGDDRNLPARQRQGQHGADEVGVALIVRVHGDGGVAQHGLGTGGGDGQRPVRN